jgi:Zn-dependent peptidase ImmA (M78 family)
MTNPMAASNADMLALTRELPIPVPWDRNVFVENLGRLRGRGIRLIPTDTAALADSPCGLWLACDDEDLILHEIGTTDYHIDQIVGHEIGHILLGHGRSGDHDFDAAHDRKVCRQALPDLDPDTVRAVLGRADYASDQEREAEMFASLLLIAAAEAAERHSMMRSAFFRRQ